MKSAKSALVLVFGSWGLRCAACAATKSSNLPSSGKRPSKRKKATALQALERAVAVAYEREQAMAERVRQLETSNAQLRQALRDSPKPEPRPKCSAGFFAPAVPRCAQRGAS